MKPYDFSKSHFFDKDGNPIDVLTWGRLGSDKNYKFLKVDAVKTMIPFNAEAIPHRHRMGDKELKNAVAIPMHQLLQETEITTVWLGDNFDDEMQSICGGIDLNAPDYKPRIFGTYIHHLGYEFRHSTVAEAIDRHDKLVDILKRGDKEALDEMVREHGI